MKFGCCAVRKTILPHVLWGMLLCVAICHGRTTSGQTVDPVSSPDGIGFSRVLEALQLARTAAEADVTDVSLEAVQQSLQTGLPFPDRNSDFRKNSEIEIRLQIENRISADLRSLHQLWLQKKVDAGAICDTLEAIVFPTSTSPRICRYQESAPGATTRRSFADTSVGMLLIRQSIACGRADSLRARLIQLSESDDVAADAIVLRMQLALEQNDRVQLNAVLTGVDRRFLESSDRLNRECLIVLMFDPRIQADEQLRAMCDSLLIMLIRDSHQWFTSAVEAQLPRRILLMQAHRALLSNNVSDAIAMLRQSDQLTDMIALDMSETARAAFLLKHRVLKAAMLLMAGPEADAVSALQSAVQAESQVAADSTRSVSEIAWMAPLMRRLPAALRFEVLSETLISSQGTLRLPWFRWHGSESPPDAVARQLPEAARKTLQLEQAGRENPISSLLELIDAAAECGRVEDLRQRFQIAADKGDSTAILMDCVLLARLGQQHTLAKRLAEIPNETARAESDRRSAVALLLVAELQKSALFPAHSQTQLDAILNATETSGGDGIRRAAAWLRREPEDQSLFQDPGTEEFLQTGGLPTRWSVSGNTSLTAQANGLLPNHWAANFGCVVHDSGPGNDHLYSPIPLTGSFAVHCDVWVGERNASHLGYDGLTVEPNGSGTISVSSLNNSSLSVRTLKFQESNTWALQSAQITPDRVTWLVNGHPVWSKPRDNEASPWFFLSSSGDEPSLWRNFRIEGSPEIPAEIRLSDNDQLRGWTCHLTGQSRTDAQADSTTLRRVRPESVDWLCRDGIIFGRRLTAGDDFLELTPPTHQALLQYERPLSPGERVQWQFEYVPDEVQSHVAVGRNVFLIHLNRIDLHWMPLSWQETLLFPVENAVTLRTFDGEPLIKAGWNDAELRMEKEGVTLIVNGASPVMFPLRPDHSRQFGIFHFCHETAARVRGIRLTGPWGLMPSDNGNVRDALQAVFKSAQPTDYAAGVPYDAAWQAATRTTVDQVNSLPESDRFAWLKDWIVPKKADGPWRFHAAARNQETHPLRVAIGDTALNHAESFLTSPVLLLRNLPTENAVRQDFVSRLIAWREHSQPSSHRFLEAMLALDALQRRDMTQTENSIRRLASASSATSMHSNPWPELLVADQAATVEQFDDLLLPMLLELQLPANTVEPGMRTAIQVRHSLIALLQARQKRRSGVATQKLTGWTPFRPSVCSEEIASINETGWIAWADGQIQHVTGTTDDAIMWSEPLSASFEFECRLIPANGRILQPGYGGYFVVPSKDTQSGFALKPSRLGRAQREKTIEVQSPVDVKLNAHDQQLDLWINGQFTETVALSASSPPWLCVRGSGPPGAAMERVRLSDGLGTPRSWPVDTSPELIGWATPWLDDGLFDPASRRGEWRSEQARLTSLQRLPLEGTHSESLIYYAYPLPESARVTWSFRVGENEDVHPVIGREALIVRNGQSVGVHPVSRGGWEPASTPDAPAQITWMDQSPPVTLRLNDWNEGELTISRGELRLIVNGEEVLSRRLPADDRRFGFFHWCSSSAAVVRDIQCSKLLSE